MATNPALAWILVMVVIVILIAITWLSGLLVGELFPAFMEIGDPGEFAPVTLVKTAILIWMPLGLTIGFLTWAIAYTFIHESVVR